MGKLFPKLLFPSDCGYECELLTPFPVGKGKGKKHLGKVRAESLTSHSFVKLDVFSVYFNMI